MTTWALLLLLLGFSFVLGIVVRSLLKVSAAPCPSNRGSWVWVFLASAVGLFLLGMTYTTIRVGRHEHIAVTSSHSGIETTRSTSPTGTSTATLQVKSTSPTVAPSMIRPTSRFWEAIYAARIKLAIVLLVGVFALIASWRKSSRPASVPARGLTDSKVGLRWLFAPCPQGARRATQESKVGLGWLFVPIACLAVLGYLSAPTLWPQTNSELGKPPAISASMQERMDKAVRDLIASSSKPDGEVQNIPDWITDKSRRPNSYLLSSGQYTTRQEAEDELLPIAADLLQRAFHEQHSWQGAWIVPLAQVRERVIEQHVERRNITTGNKSFEMYRLHMLVNVAPEVCETFTESWRSQIVERRLRVFGVLLAWLTCVLLLGRAYFWSLTLPGNSHHWASFLKATVMTISLTVLAAWVLMEYIH